MNATSESSLKTVLRNPGDGTLIRAFGGDLRFFLTGKESGGWLTAGMLVAPPGNGPPLHIHRDEDELLFVIEGRFSFFADGQCTEGGPGTTVFLPRGQAHAFRNIGDTPGKLYVLANPPGLETFFPACEEPFCRPEGPDMEAIVAIAADHGIRFVDPPPAGDSVV